MKIDMQNYEEWMIAAVEGSLGLAEEAELEAFLESNPGLRYELDLYRETRLQPDTSIVFPDREALKKSPQGGRIIGFSPFMRYAAAVAALLVIAAGIRFFLPANNSTAPSISYTNTVSPLRNTRQVLSQDMPKQTGEPAKQHDESMRKVYTAEENSNPATNRENRERDLAAMIIPHAAVSLQGDSHMPRLKSSSIHIELDNWLPDETYAQNSPENQSVKNIMLNDNTSLVDWWNDASALGGEMGSALGFSKKEKAPQQMEQNPYKTMNIQIFGINYYSRKKENN